MKITHLKLDDMYTALSNTCFCFDGGRQGDRCTAVTLNLGCPFGTSVEGETVQCKNIRPEHWRLVFEGKDEQEPEPEMPFQFGDKVTVTLNSPCEAVFSAYLGDGMAYVLFEGETCCEEVAVCDLKAGWDD